MQCPSCSAAVAEGASECSSCGIILSKWRGARTTQSRPVPTTTSPPIPVPRRRAPVSASIVITVIVVVIAAGATGTYLWLRSRSVDDSPTAEKKLKRIESTRPDFDIVYDLPGSPQGLASNGRELVIGNRMAPAGIIRLRRQGDDFKDQRILLIEPRYRQKMNVDALTWNGKNYVGFTSAGWFENGKTGRVFAILDPTTLQVVDHRPAPEHLGCLAWDGKGYWAATRRNTADSGEEVKLYRFDADFRLLHSTDSPGVGCQGLAWDGNRLWLADVFTDAIYVIDVSSGNSRVIYTSYPNVSYLSGITSFEGEMWITDYGDNRLYRIRPSSRTAWIRGESARPEAVALASAATPTVVHGEASSVNVDEVRRKLRSSDKFERMSAEMELDRLEAPIDYAREENSFAKRPADDTELLDWTVEMRDGVIWGSWKMWFGHDLFLPNQQQSAIVTIPVFARYEITVKPPNDAPEIKQEFTATAGEHVKSDVRLADVTTPGEYRVSVFIHVQYVTREGTGRILNNSAGSLELRR